MCPLVFFASAISMTVYFRSTQSPSDIGAAEASLSGKFNAESPMTLPKAVESKSLLVRRLSASAEDDELRRVSIHGWNSSSSLDKEGEDEGGKLEVLNSPTVPHAAVSRLSKSSYGASVLPVKSLSGQIVPPAQPPQQDASGKQVLLAPQPPQQDSAEQTDTPRPPEPRKDLASSLPTSSLSNTASSNPFRANKRISYLADEVGKTAPP
jgi:hypothetical protein